MSREEITLGLAVANFILTWGVALYMYMANKNKATNERIGKLEEDLVVKIEGHGGRIMRLETVVENAPTHDHLAQVYEAQKRSDEKLNQLIGENRSQTDTLRLILNQITQKGMA